MSLLYSTVTSVPSAVWSANLILLLDEDGPSKFGSLLWVYFQYAEELSFVAQVEAELLYQKNLGSVTPVVAPELRFGNGPAHPKNLL